MAYNTHYTWAKGTRGLRGTDAGVFLSDLDPAWALDSEGMMILDADFARLGGLADRINTLYGKEVVMHPTHWQGIAGGVPGVVVSTGDKSYFHATVYVYGKNIDGRTGFLEMGPGLELYHKYYQLLHK